MKPYIAHSPGKKSQPPGQAHLLAEHLREVARLARDFAREAFQVLPGEDAAVRGVKNGFPAAAGFSGLLHDLGKYRPEFQAMLDPQIGHPKNEKTWHKQAGAAKAFAVGRADLAFAIAGHHGHMPSASELKQMVRGEGGEGVASQVWPVAVKELPELDAPLPSGQGGTDKLLFDFLTRLLLSCLVDADWQDTSCFKNDWPEPEPIPLEPSSRLQKVLAHISKVAAKCESPNLATIRGDILDAALAAGDEETGLFTMSVPTGGGKTLASLAFALKHAARHGLRRIVYVAPYLTILEQNVRVLRKALGVKPEEAVLFEHHSLSQVEGHGNGNEAEAEEALRRAENWSAPLIVTTNVQFFESLFNNRPGPCRKLHRLARSVVLLDECQTLPPGLVAPTCDMLQQIVKYLGCSIVLCTATQPAWRRRPGLESGLPPAHEIAPPALDLFAKLRRVRIRWPKDRDEKLDWPVVAGQMRSRTSALCVVNTRQAALDLYAELKGQGSQTVFHLSTTMCPRHRLSVLDDVRKRLKGKAPCLLVSTQLIEAGCDVDFPFVMREMAPLEAIIQAAGRCNREGLLCGPEGNPDGGRVVVFRSVEGRLPKDRWYAAGRDVVENHFLARRQEPDVGGQKDMEDYFIRLLHAGDVDARRIQAARAAFNFPEVAEKYRLIEEETFAVVPVNWEAHEAEIQTLLDAVRKAPSRKTFRALAPFQVNLRGFELAKAAQMVTEDPSGVRLWTGVYDKEIGLRLEGNLGNCVV